MIGPDRRHRPVTGSVTSDGERRSQVTPGGDRRSRVIPDGGPGERGPPTAPGDGPGERGRRGLSTVVNYALMLVVVAVLVAGLVVGVNGHVESTHERVVRAELAVVGNHLAADLGTADRLAGSLDDGTVRYRADLVERVAGRTYLIDLDSAAGTNRYVITLATASPDVSVSVHLRTDRPLDTGRYHGGPLVVTSDGTSLEVAHG